MKIIYNDIIPFEGFKALNFCGLLFVRRGVIIDDVTINHEGIHTKQMQEMLYVFFLLWYVIEWFCKLFVSTSLHGAYRKISFEREAYNNEKNFGYIAQRKHYAWFKLIIQK